MLKVGDGNKFFEVVVNCSTNENASLLCPPLGISSSQFHYVP